MPANLPNPLRDLERPTNIIELRNAPQAWIDGLRTITAKHCIVVPTIPDNVPLIVVDHEIRQASNTSAHRVIEILAVCPVEMVTSAEPLALNSPTLWIGAFQRLILPGVHIFVFLSQET